MTDRPRIDLDAVEANINAGEMARCRCQEVLALVAWARRAADRIAQRMSCCQNPHCGSTCVSCNIDRSLLREIGR